MGMQYHRKKKQKRTLADLSHGWMVSIRSNSNVFVKEKRGALRMCESSILDFGFVPCAISAL